jgi:transcriptional regulator with XRE-family HTH domain
MPKILRSQSLLCDFGNSRVDSVTLGQRIRIARERQGLSQEDFAALLSRDQRAVSEYERGKRKIAVTDLPRFADILHVPLQYFYDETTTLDELEPLLLQEFRRLPTAQAKQAAIDLIRILFNAIE